jgi:hypothetical protein
MGHSATSTFAWTKEEEGMRKEDLNNQEDDYLCRVEWEKEKEMLWKKNSFSQFYFLDEQYQPYDAPTDQQ